MPRLHTAVLAVVLAAAGAALSASPAAADQLASCDATAAPGLAWYTVTEHNRGRSHDYRQRTARDIVPPDDSNPVRT